MEPELMSLPQAIHIYAAGSCTTVLSEEKLLPLKDQVLEKTGIHIRRIGRFIQLALIGVGDCLQQKKPASDTAVYLASEHGDMETTLEVLRAMLIDGMPPKPLNFINTVSNAACFYIGNTFSLRGESHFISSVHGAFEKSLISAAVDLSVNAAPAALVGSVDIATLPLSHHQQRISGQSRHLYGEGSHWLYLAIKDMSAEMGKPLAVIRSLCLLANLDLLKTSNSILPLAAEKYQGGLAVGIHLSLEDVRILQKMFPLAKVLRDGEDAPFYNSRSSAYLSDFVRQPEQSSMLYVNRDGDGNYCVCYLDKC
jgi:hypothetical protein